MTHIWIPTVDLPGWMVACKLLETSKGYLLEVRDFMTSLEESLQGVQQFIVLMRKEIAYAIKDYIKMEHGMLEACPLRKSKWLDWT